MRGATLSRDARRGGAFSNVEVESLPLGSTTLTRSFDELALYLNDVALPPQSVGGGSGPGIGAGVGTSGQFSVNGLRSRANNFTVDGSDNNDEDIGVRRQGFFALVPQPIESIQEFQIITLLAPAQFGRNVGAQVNAISKSGGSETHGTIYGIFNTSQLNARNFFDSARGNAVTPLLAAAAQPVIITPNVSFNPQTINFDPVGGSPVTVRNGSGGEDSFTLGQGGVTLGGTFIPNRLFFFFSAEGQLLNGSREASFIVPTVAQRGAFGTGATGITIDPINGERTFSLPTTFGGDAVFSLFPFPNDPGGIYGANTFTQSLPASARGKIFSGKFDGNFSISNRPQSVTGRYNFTDDWREIPVTGGALFSTLRPRVRTQNFSFFFNSELSAPDSSTLLFNQARLSYGRTRLKFEEVRDREFQTTSDAFPDEPFLLNAPLRSNLTLPNFDRVNDRLVPNAGPVIYLSGGTAEQFLGPVGQVNVAGFSPIGVDVFNFPQRPRQQHLPVRRPVHRAHAATMPSSSAPTIAAPNSTACCRATFARCSPFNGAPGVTGDLALTDFFVAPVNLAAASAPSRFLPDAYQRQRRRPSTSASTSTTFTGRTSGASALTSRSPTASVTSTTRPSREANRRIEDTFSRRSGDTLLVPGAQRPSHQRSLAASSNRTATTSAPRLGIAYSPNLFGEPGTTLFRVGYGHYNDIVLGAVVSQSRNVFPTFLTVNTAGGLGNLFFPELPAEPAQPVRPGSRSGHSGHAQPARPFALARRANRAHQPAGERGGRAAGRERRRDYAARARLAVAGRASLFLQLRATLRL